MTEKLFEIQTDFQPCGDQPQAIQSLLENFKKKKKHQVLLGVTGSGKTFTMAHTILNMNRPSLVLAHNKTLAAQLYEEFKELFPKNAVEYFVSYYDYYQPEAYLPASDIYIEKDASINQQIDRMRHSATRSLLERQDVIIVSSVSCIYGLGSPETYEEMTLSLEVNMDLRRDTLLRDLVKLHYSRKDHQFERGSFRVRGDLVEIHPPYEEARVLRVEFFGNFIDSLSWVDPFTTEIVEEVEKVSLYPGSHYVSSKKKLRAAIHSIEEELREQIQSYESQCLFEKAERIKQRTLYDLEILQEVGFCPGIENYSRHFTGRQAGESPPTLLEYFPKDFLTFIDESHATIPQVGGMYRGDRSRKETLVEHAFRLPSALDNRPLNFKEFEAHLNKVVYVSATPGDYEMKKSRICLVEQINRPTALLDPVLEVRKAGHQVKDLIQDIEERQKKKERILVTTLTKKSAESLTSYYESLGIRVKYLHSDIDTLERSEIIRDLRKGVFDVLVGINLLREGLDLPEVSLVAIMDADKEGFLRSERSLIQTIGRAARHVSGRVILYADRETDSMKKAIYETKRRRQIQEAFNIKHKRTPRTVKKKMSQSLLDVFENRKAREVLSGVKTQKGRISKKRVKKACENLELQILNLRKKMKTASDNLAFEEARKYRDEIKSLELLQLDLLEA